MGLCTHQAPRALRQNIVRAHAETEWGAGSTLRNRRLSPASHPCLVGRAAAPAEWTGQAYPAHRRGPDDLGACGVGESRWRGRCRRSNLGGTRRGLDCSPALSSGTAKKTKSECQRVAGWDIRPAQGHLGPAERPPLDRTRQPIRRYTCSGGLRVPRTTRVATGGRAVYRQTRYLTPLPHLADLRVVVRNQHGTPPLASATVSDLVRPPSGVISSSSEESAGDTGTRERNAVRRDRTTVRLFLLRGIRGPARARQSGIVSVPPDSGFFSRLLIVE